MVSINGSVHSQTFTREKSEAVTPVTGSVEFSSKPGTGGTEIYKAQWHPARIVFDIFGQEARQSLTELLLLKVYLTNKLMPHFNVSFLYCQVVDFSQIDGHVYLVSLRL